MIRLPNKHFGVSNKVHNNNLMVLCDWVEASALVQEQSITKSALADLLVEEHLYSDQDFCSSRMEDVWTEVTRRQSLLGDASFLDVSTASLSPRQQWTDTCATTFCLMCSLKPNLTDWTAQFGRKHLDQGELFERICEASLRVQLPSFNVKRTGWGSSNTSGLAKVIRDLADFLGDDVGGHLKKWVPAKGKEAGVDLAWLRPMADGLAGPRYFGQCASGNDWMRKRSEPDLETWGKFIDFVNVPQRVLLMPFALTPDEFIRASPPIKGVLVDRYRLLAAGKENTWVDAGLRKDLEAWLRPRIDWISASNLSLSPV